MHWQGDADGVSLGLSSCWHFKEGSSSLHDRAMLAPGMCNLHNDSALSKGSVSQRLIVGSLRESSPIARSGWENNVSIVSSN